MAVAIAIALASAGGCGSDDSDGSGGAAGVAGGAGAGAGGQDSGSSGSSGQDSGTSGSSSSDAQANDAAGGSAGNDAAADSAPAGEDCKNGVDDDADKNVDCADSQCSTSTDCGELEKCGDSTDNDSDGFDDCNDSECSCASSCGGPSCPGGSAGLGTGAVNLPNTDGACHAYAGSCSPGASPERTLSFTATTAGQYYFSLTGLTAQAVMFIRKGDCAGTEAACKVAPSFNGAAEVVLTLSQNETVVVFVESTSTATGMFDLIVDKVP